MRKAATSDIKSIPTADMSATGGSNQVFSTIVLVVVTVVRASVTVSVLTSVVVVVTVVV